MLQVFHVTWRLKYRAEFPHGVSRTRSIDRGAWWGTAIYKREKERNEGTVVQVLNVVWTLTFKETFLLQVQCDGPKKAALKNGNIILRIRRRDSWLFVFNGTRLTRDRNANALQRRLLVSQVVRVRPKEALDEEREWLTIKWRKEKRKGQLFCL